VTTWRRTPLASTKRLVNRSVKPAGRLGAPETDPGPSGVGGGVEGAFMAISSRPRPSRDRRCPQCELLARPVTPVENTGPQLVVVAGRRRGRADQGLPRVLRRRLGARVRWVSGGRAATAEHMGGNWMNLSRRLAGQTVVVIGGSSGIGL